MQTTIAGLAMLEAAARTSPAGEDPQAVLQQLSGDLMSPYCPGRTIASCPSGAARKLEDEILAQAQAGKTRAEIEASLVERFGEDIIGYRPPPFLLGGTVVLGLIALLTLVVLGRRWSDRTRRSAVSASVGAADVPTSGPTQPSKSDLDALDDALDEDDSF
jgi:cytochrome c-type biogenesis protein CcmH/NrfF